MWLYVGVIVAIYVIYVLMTYMFGKNHVTKDISMNVSKATEEKVIEPSSMPLTPYGQGVRWTLSFWVYVNDLNYRYGKRKHIMTRRLAGTKYTSIDIYIEPRTATVQMDYYDTGNTQRPKTVSLGILPLKKWQQFTVVQERNNIDILLDGRIVFTNAGANPIVSHHGEEVVIAEHGGWSGYYSKVHYSNYNQSLQEIRSYVDEGPLEMSWINPLFYLYLGVGFVNSFNQFILTLFLPNPEDAAKKALSEKHASDIEQAKKSDPDTSSCPKHN